MSLTKLRTSGVQGVGLIAVTYVYFLIFAQFAFIHRLDTLGIAGASLEVRHGRHGHRRNPAQPARSAREAFLPLSRASSSIRLCLAGIAAFLTIAPLTVGARDRRIHAHRREHSACSPSPSSRIFASGSAITTPLLKVGLGTGIGYFLCNVPSLFTATPQVQSATAGLLCLIGIVLANFTVEASTESNRTLKQSGPLHRPQHSIRPRRRILRRSHLARLRRLLHHPEHHRPQSRHVARLGTPLGQRAHSPRRSHVQCMAAAPSRTRPSFWPPPSALSLSPAFYCSIPHAPSPHRSSIPLASRSIR